MNIPTTAIHVIKKYILPTILVVLASCCCQESNPDLHPSSDIEQYTHRAITQWLDIRMDEPEWQIFSKPDASWKSATSLDAISLWFQQNLGTSSSKILIWNFSRLILDIKKTEIYLRGPPSAEDFLKIVKVVLLAYKYKQLG